MEVVRIFLRVEQMWACLWAAGKETADRRLQRLERRVDYSGDGLLEEKGGSGIESGCGGIGLGKKDCIFLGDRSEGGDCRG